MVFRPALLLFALLTVPSTWAATEVKRQLAGSTVIDPNADCVLADSSGVNWFFNNGDSFGDLTPLPCGNAAQFPCFCDTTQPSNIRCPYCFFPSSGGGISCAQDGGDVSFTDPFGIQQTCDCAFIGGSNFTSNCTGQAGGGSGTGEPTCTLQSNTDQCATLTEGMDFGNDCQCATFCLGGFSGCCQSGAACTVECPGGLGDIVGGCPIMGSSQQPPATPAPVALPTVPPTTIMPTATSQPPVTSAPGPLPTVPPTTIMPTSLPVDNFPSFPTDLLDDNSTALPTDRSSENFTVFPSEFVDANFTAFPSELLDENSTAFPSDLLDENSTASPSDPLDENSTATDYSPSTSLLLLLCLCVQLTLSLL